MPNSLRDNDGKGLLSHAADKDVFTVEDVGFGKFQIRMLFMCGFCWMADAMEIMLLSFLMSEAKKEFNLENWQEATLGSSTFVGMVIGSYFWGFVSDRYGRKMGYLGTGLFTGIFGLLSALSPSFLVLLISRSLVGFGLGGAPVAFSMFAEFLPMANRGIPLILFEVFWTVGTIGEAGLAWLILPTLGWRWLLGLSSLPLFITLLFFPFLPESPRYLLVGGNRTKCLQILRNLAHTNKGELPTGTLAEPPPSENAKKARLLDLLAPSLRMLTVLLWIIWFANAFVYYGLILFTPNFFAHSAEGEVSSSGIYLNVFITTSAELPGLLVAGFLVDKLGRKYSQALQFGFCGLFTLLLIIRVNEWAQLGFASVARLFIMGAFSTTYVYTPEVYPTVVRATGLGICAAVSKVAGSVTPYIASLFQDSDPWISLVTYGGVAFAAALASFFLPIETKQRALLDVIEPRQRPRSYGASPTDPTDAIVP